MESAVSEALSLAIDQVAALAHDTAEQEDVELLVRASCSPTSEYKHVLHESEDGAETKQDVSLLSWEEDAAAEDERKRGATGIVRAEAHPLGILRTYRAAPGDREEEGERYASNEELRSHAFLELDLSAGAVDSIALSEEEDRHGKDEEVNPHHRTVRDCQDSDASHSEQEEEAEVHDHEGASSPFVIAASPVHPLSGVYSMTTIFPRVFERNVIMSRKSDSIDLKPCATNHLAPSDATPQSSDGGEVRPPKVRANSSTQSHPEGTRSQVRDQTRTHQLHLSMVESERKNLSQRNTRQTLQLNKLTADLQRTKAELSKLRTENELYASKLPQLQAELLEESAQVDEKDAQSVQSQLQLTQWKARVQVFQTRHDNVERLNAKLQVSLRNCKAELQRKASTNQQQVEKTKTLERDLSSAKTAHAQELLALKQKLASAIQKGEHDRLTSERTAKQSMELQVRTAKAKAAKAMKKCDELQALVVSMGEKQKQLKREYDAAQMELISQVKQTRTLETLLQKAHRSEASLRSQNASLKAKARAVDEQIKQRVVGLAGSSHSRKRTSNRIPMELLMLVEDEDDDDYVRTIKDTHDHCKCCIQRTSHAPEEQQQRVDADSAEISLQLRMAKDEILRLRDLHAQELRAQSTAYTQLLKRLGAPLLPPANNLSGSA